MFICELSLLQIRKESDTDRERERELVLQLLMKEKMGGETKVFGLSTPKQERGSSN